MIAFVSTHHIHSWSIDGESHVFSVHLVFQRNATAETVRKTKGRVRELLDPHGFEHTTIETEIEGETCELDEATTPSENASRHVH